MTLDAPPKPQRRPTYPSELITRLETMLKATAAPVRSWYSDPNWQPAIWQLSSLRSLRDRIAFAAYPYLALWCRGAIGRASAKRIRVGHWDHVRCYLHVYGQLGRDVGRFLDPSLARLINGWTRGRHQDDYMCVRPNGEALVGDPSPYDDYIMSHIGSRWKRSTVNEAVFSYAYNYNCGDQLRYPTYAAKHIRWKARQRLQKDTTLLAQNFRHHPLPGIPMAHARLLQWIDEPPCSGEEPASPLLSGNLGMLRSEDEERHPS